MSEFQTSTLNDMCELIIDCPHFTPEWTTEGFLVIRNQNIRNGRLDLSDKSFTHKEDFERRITRAKPQEGDIIFTREAPMGEVCIIPEDLECCVGQRQVLLRPKADIAGKYLFFALQSPYVRHQIFWNEGTGSTVSNVRIPVLKALKIPRQSNEKAIASILSSLDDKIELNRRMNETLEAMARAIFKDLFVDFGPTRAKQDGRAAYLPEPLWSLFPDEIDGSTGLPQGWQLVEIRDICSAIYSGGTPSTKNLENWGGDIPWLSSGETRNTFIIDTERKITDAGVQSSSTRKVPPLATVIAGAGQGNTRGQTSLLGIETYINQSVVALVAKNDLISPHFLFFDLERRYEEFRRVSDAHSSRGSLTTKLLAELESNLPHYSLIQGFESICGSTIQKCFINLLESRTLAELRDRLLPKLMSGEIRVKDAEKLVEDAV